MHKIAVIVVLLLSVAFAAEVVTFDNSWGKNPLFNVVSETPSGLEIVFSVHEMVVEEAMIDGVNMKSLGVPAVYLPNEGVPNLSGVSRYIAIPRGARAQVTILGSRTEVHHSVEVAPAPTIPRENDDSPLRYEKNMSIYGRNAYYPDTPVRLSQPMKIRGVDVVMLGVMPFQYNPVTKELIVYKDIRLRVDFAGGDGHFGEDRLRSRFWEPILENHLLNYSTLPKIDFYAPERIHSRNGYEYIILVPDDPVFEAWGDTIMRWRTLQGISCDVFTLTEVGGSTKEAIKNFLENAYDTWNPAPVAFLLLSDYPTSGDGYGITSNVITHPYGYAAYASDNWYADFDNDTLPELHHGRICAQTETQLNTMIYKFLSYERNPYTAANFYNEPLVACGWQTSRWFQMCIEVCKGFFENELGKLPQHQANVYSGDPYAGCDWTSRSGSGPVIQYWVDLGYIPPTNPHPYSYWDNGSATGVNAAINSGAFMVQHRDHGSETGWSEPNYHNADINGLTNTSFTFVNSTNCLTGRYHWSSECFTEKFHRIAHGALGVNGASSVSYSFVNDTYIWGTFDGLWPFFDPGYPAFDLTGSDDLRPCQAMTSAKYYLEASWFPDQVGAGSYRNITYGLFHHHGDCFITLYTEIPQNLTVSHDPTVPAGQDYFTVSANDGAVIALTVSGEIIGVAAGTGSPVDIPITTQTAGDTMLVTVTKANYYRYEEELPVVTGETYPPCAPCITQAEKNISDVILTWNTVTDDTLGNEDTIDCYIVYRNTSPSFVPDVLDSIGACTHPDTTYTDIDAMNGPQSYYYLVKSVDNVGNESKKSNMGYVLHKPVNENPDATDKNLVSLAYTSEYSTISDLADDLSPNGDPIIKITNLRDDQLYESWSYSSIPPKRWTGTDFAIIPGRAYEMVTVKDTFIVLVGCNEVDGLVSLNENPGAADKNWVSIPYNAAYSFVSDITDEYSPVGNPLVKITNLRDDQLYESWTYSTIPFPRWTGTDFAITSGRGYEFVTSVDTTWNPTEWNNEISSGLEKEATARTSDFEISVGTLNQPDRRPIWVMRDGDYTPSAALFKEEISREPGVSHTVRADLQLKGFENLIFTTYRPDKPYDVLTEKVIGCGSAHKDDLHLIWFDVGNFREPWHNGEEVVLIIEASKDGQAYFVALSVILDERVDIQHLPDTITLMPIPEPVAGKGVMSWHSIDNDYIIGYSIYNGGERLNNLVVTDETYAADDGYLKLVLKGGHETEYGSQGLESATYGKMPSSVDFVVSQNPFTKAMKMFYQVPSMSMVDLRIYDAGGRQVRTLVQKEIQPPGDYTEVWYGVDDVGHKVASGVYFVRFETDNFDTTEKIIFVR